MITDYDSWKDEEAPVTVEMVIENLTKNSENAKKVIESVVKKIPGTPNYPAHSALKNAIFTERSLWPTKTVNNLATILGKYL
jgi:5'-methylthioadenosine phosphorylase